MFSLNPYVRMLVCLTHVASCALIYAPLRQQFGSLVSFVCVEYGEALIKTDPRSEGDGAWTLFSTCHCLTDFQTKAFCKFLPVIVVLYLGQSLSEGRAQRSSANFCQAS